MGYGATPHRIKDARGADGPRLFLEKKEGKKNSRKRCFRRGIMDFAEICFCLAGEYAVSYTHLFPGRETVKMPNWAFLTVFSLDYYEFKWSKLRISSAKPDFVGLSH